MTVSYVPAGRWVRVRSARSAGGEAQGRWHLATDDPRFSFAIPSSRALVACGRNLSASPGEGTELAIADDLPRAHVCSICTERYVRDRLFEIRVHNLTTAAPV